MSTKTNFKRVALVAVASLGLGVLTSVAPASATAVANETLSLGVVAAVTPDISMSSSGATSQTDTDSTTSFGLITTTGGTATGTNAKTLTAGATGTGVVYATAILGMGIDSASKASIVVTGGTITKIQGAAANAISGTGTSAVTAANGDIMGVLVRPGVAAGLTFTVAAYTGANVSAATPTNGVLAGIWTFTVAASSGAGVYSAADSTVAQQAGVAKGIAAAGTNTYDTSARLDNGQVGIIYVALEDAYGSPITTGTLAASATAGTVAITTSPASGQSYGATASFDTETPAAANYIYVNQPAANTAGSSTVTITHDGQVVGTKTITWAGDIASLTVDTANSAGTFANGVDAGALASNTASIGNVVYMAKDAAGNVVNLSAQPTVTGATGALVGASVYSGNTLTSGGSYQTAARGYGITTMFVPSSILNGAAAYQLQITNAAGATVKSAVVSAKVSNGGTHTFAVTWDKTAYVSGDIATMSIASKDAYGNTIAEGTYLTGLSLAVNSGGFQDLSACSATSSFSTGGVKKCKYAVLNDAGSYAYSVDLDSGSDQAAVVGTVAVTTGAAGVTNADVLKAIVSLIASINKQIAALQKALLKK